MTWRVVCSGRSSRHEGCGCQGTGAASLQAAYCCQGPVSDAWVSLPSIRFTSSSVTDVPAYLLIWVMFMPVLVMCDRYYGICFLNTLLLSHDERQLASRLLTVYFTFFKVRRPHINRPHTDNWLNGECPDVTWTLNQYVYVCVCVCVCVFSCYFFKSMFVIRHFIGWHMAC